MAIRVELELDDGNFVRGVQRAGTTLADFERQTGRTVVGIEKLNESHRSMLSGLRDVTVIIATAGAALDNLHKISTGLVGKIIEINATVQRLQASLASLSTAANPFKDAAEDLAKLREQAKQAPFSLEAMHQAFLKLKTGGIDANTRSMKDLTDAVSAFGGTDDQLRRASLAIQEMGGKGVVQMKELRTQLAQAVPGALQIMSRAFGVTYEQLTKDIHTGTVDAKQAIAAFFAETNRSFGDASIRQMETYNGQMMRLGSVIMSLGIEAGGLDKKGSFFEKITKGLTEFNDALDSSAGKVVAQKLGAGLSSAFDTIKGVIDKLIEMRGVIFDVGRAMANAFVIKIGADAMSGAIRFMENMVNHAGLAVKQMQILRSTLAEIAQTTSANIAGQQAANAAVADFARQRAQQNAANALLQVQPGQWSSAASAVQIQAAMANAGSGMTMMQRLTQGATTAMIGFGGAVRVVGSLLPAIATGFLAFAPYLPIIAGGISLIADYFDIFGNKAKTAWQELDQFGAHSMKQVEDAKKYVETLKKAYEDARDSQEDVYGTNASSADVEAKRKAYEEAKAKMPGFELGGVEGDSDKLSKEVYQELIHDENSLRTEYRKTTQTLLDETERRQKALVTQKRDPSEEQARYATRLKEEAVKFYEAQIAEAQVRYDAFNEMAARGDEVGRNVAEKSQKVIMDHIKDIKQRMQEEIDRPLGVPKGVKGFDPAAAFEKGNKQLDKLNAGIEGFTAAIRYGADPAVAELRSELENGVKFGDSNVAAVQALIDKVVEAKGRFDELKKVMEDGTKLTKAIEDLGLGIQEKLFEEQTRGLSEVDKLIMKINSGYYKGYGNARDPESKRMIELRQHIDGTKVSADDLGKSLENGVFGPKAITAAETYLGTVSKIGTIFTTLQANAQGLDLSKAFGTIGSGQMLPMGVLPATSFNPNVTEAEQNSKVGMSIQRSAAKYNMDPMTSMMVAKMEGGFSPVRPGDDGSSFGPFQLHYGGIAKGANAVAGLGDEYTKETGFSATDPDHVDDAIDWSMKHASMRGWGAFHGAARAGISNFQGIGVNPGVRSPGAPLVPVGTPIPQYPPQNEKAPDGTYGYGTNGPAVRPTFAMDSHDGRPDNTPDADWFKIQQSQEALHKANIAGAQNKINDAKVKLEQDIAVAKLKLDGMGSKEAAAREAITRGERDESNRDPDSSVYKKELNLARQKDELDKNQVERRKQITRGEDAYRNLSKEATDNKERVGQVFANLDDPNGIDFSKSYMQKERETRARLGEINKAKQLGGKNEIGNDGAELGSSAIAQARNLDVANLAATLQKKSIAIRESLMTQEDAQKAQYDRDMERMRQGLAIFTGTEEQKAQLSKIYSEAADAEAAKRFSQSPIGAQMKGFTDITKNVGTSMTQTMGTAIDNLTSMISGTKVKWTSLIQSMGRDLLKNALQYGLGSIFNKGAGAAGLTGGASRGPSAGLGMLSSLGNGGITGIGSAFSGISSLFSMFHGGGIIGASGGAGFKNIDLSHFTNAPRFHTGGVIGHDEVPIIAQKGEGVFTKGQMQVLAKGGSGGNTVNFGDINVNANGGTPAQNEDLAKQFSKHLGEMVDKRIAGNLRQQTRPGNMLAGLGGR